METKFSMKFESIPGCEGFARVTAAAFAAAAEQFLKAQLQRSFKTLDFYHELGGTAP